MKKIIKIFGLVFLVVIVTLIINRRTGKESGFQPLVGGETPSVSQSVPVNTDFCDDTLAVEAGTLCAIQPSKTGSGILDIAEATGARRDAKLGFGYHVLGIPDDISKAKGVWVHLTGSYGRPYDQRLDIYSNKVWLDEIMDAGYVVIQLAYNNRYAINIDLCGPKSEGYNRNDCAGEVREINLSGEGTSPYRNTNQFNTIDHRLMKLLIYLEEEGLNLPGDIDPTNIDWEQIHISGHSQGANQAYYIAKHRTVASACILAGGYDIADTVQRGELSIADWFLVGGSMTPLSRITAFLTTTDDSYQSFLFGLTKAVGIPMDQIVIADKRTYTDQNGKELSGHAGTIKDPSLKAQRASACF